MNTLQEIGLKTGTDKARHVHNTESYLDVYAHYLESMRTQARHVLEFGILRGDSLRMWAEYFPNAQIYGVDIDPSTLRDYGPRIQVSVADQTDASALAAIAPGSTFDVVIDDASHVVDLMLRTFEIIWPRVKSGGVYIMEDLGNSYLDLTPFKNDWPGQRYNTQPLNHRRETFDQFLVSAVRQLDLHQNQLRSIQLWPDRCVLLKA